MKKDPNITADAPSALYRQHIRNIAGRMWRLTTETALHPLRNMTAFNKVQKDFNEAEKEANLCCSVILISLLHGLWSPELIEPAKIGFFFLR